MGGCLGAGEPHCCNEHRGIDVNMHLYSGIVAYSRVLGLSLDDEMISKHGMWLLAMGL